MPAVNKPTGNFGEDHEGVTSADNQSTRMKEKRIKNSNTVMEEEKNR